MTTKTYCDSCGKELGKGAYRVSITAPNESFYSPEHRWDLCRKCAGSLLKWRDEFVHKVKVARRKLLVPADILRKRKPVTLRGNKGIG